MECYEPQIPIYELGINKVYFLVLLMCGLYMSI